MYPTTSSVTVPRHSEGHEAMQAKNTTKTHIINITVSHIVALPTRVSKGYLKLLRSDGDDGGNGDGDGDDGNNDNDDDDDDNSKINISLSAEQQASFSNMKCDPVKRTRTADQIKQDFKKMVKDGNKRRWF
jgi:hypothetical protein